MAEKKNRRETSRSRSRIEVELKPPASAPIPGELKDVSLTGLFVSCVTLLPVESLCGVTLFLGGRESGQRLEATAKVRRSEPGGVGLEFVEIGVDDLAHLQKLVLYNAPDPDAVERELSERHGLKKKRRN